MAKTTQMEDVRPLKTYVFYNTDHTFGHFGWAPGAHVFYDAFSDTVFLTFFATFEISGLKRSPKGGRLSGGKCV